MGEIFLKTFIIMVTLLAFILPGFILKRKNVLGDGAPKTLSGILLYVCQPALVINSFCVFSDDDWEFIQGMDKGKLALDFLIVAAISLVAMLFVYGIARLVFFKNKNRPAASVYSYVAVFSNCGFLGVPFIEMFTDGDPVAVLYIMVFNIVFIILSWTLGVLLVSGDRKNVSIKRILLNPSILASAVAMLLFFVPVLNFFMLGALKDMRMFPKLLANMTTPVAMIIVGVRLADMQAKTLFTDVGSYAAGGLRLVAAPFATCLVAYLFYLMLGSAYPISGGSDVYVYLAPIIAMAMTPASSVIAIAEMFDGDRDTATVSFTINTLVSIITIPLVMMAVMAIWQ